MVFAAVCVHSIIPTLEGNWLTWEACQVIQFTQAFQVIKAGPFLCLLSFHLGLIFLCLHSKAQMTFIHPLTICIADIAEADFHSLKHVNVIYRL